MRLVSIPGATSPVVSMLAMLAILAVTSQPLGAQSCPALIGQLPGDYRAVAASGDLVYLGNLTTLVIADVSDPSTPSSVGQVALPYWVTAIAVAGSHAYIAGRSSALNVFRECSVVFGDGFESGSTSAWPVVVP